jgi:hypothetical protein
VIVCERAGKWATAIGRHLPGGVRLLQTRGLGDCVAELTSSPASLVAFEATPRNLLGVIELLAEFARKFPAARTVVLADPSLRVHESLLREAGALHVTFSSRELEGFAVTIANHLARANSAACGAPESVWDSLPWRDAATAAAPA